ncbi:unnamed protein product [Lymnaea stagnalis]|uniref:Protein sleepless n=1 Tax=Lymnaea stagnalis TaxID=6523 RepID=A0AAV2ILH9_LYMST
MDRYHIKCEQGQDSRIGLFPARYCIKIKGTSLKTNEEMIYRSCSMSSLDNTCGLFQFENARYSGCMMSCTRDACNGGVLLASHIPWSNIGLGVVSVGLALSDYMKQIL